MRTSSWWPTACRSTWSGCPTAARRGSGAPAAWSPPWSRCCADAVVRGSAGRAYPTPMTNRSSRTTCTCVRCGCPPTRWPTTTRASRTPRCGRCTTMSSSSRSTTAKVAAEGATVWVQDYQLQLVPKMLRMLRPDLTIGFFLHIPFPPVELFMQMPWRTEIIEGLLGADLVGFHLPGGAQNFLILSRRLVGANASRANVGVRSRFGEVNVGFRTVKVGAFPISIDSGALDKQARERSVRKRAKEIRSELGNP